jgi:hypothetical protein
MNEDWGGFLNLHNVLKNNDLYVYDDIRTVTCKRRNHYRKNISALYKE